MIESASETLLALAQAADDLPRRRRARKTHISTLLEQFRKRLSKLIQEVTIHGSSSGPMVSRLFPSLRECLITH
jgi:hypothetical protein